MTYRIKRLKGEDGFSARPVDKQVSQWNAERDAKTDSLHLDANAYPPAHVYLKDDTHPRPWEVYNCTTCARAEPEHPAYKHNQNTYHVKCKPESCPMPGLWKDGPRHGDVGCQYWDRRIKVPHHGLWPGIER